MKNLLRYLIISCIFLALPISNYGQKQAIDVIYLKNGSVIKGTILSYQSDEGVKIKTMDNYTWTIKIDDIKKIERENFNPQFMEDETDISPSGFINYTSLGILAGNGNNQENAPFSILMSNGFIFQKKLSINLGTGFEFFTETYLPVFADIRYHLTSRKVTPYIALQGGYAFALEDNASTYYSYYGEANKPLGGYILNPETGLIINFRNYSALYFSAGYRRQLLRYKERAFEEAYINQYINRLSIRIGFIFR